MYLTQAGNHGLNAEIQTLEEMYSQVAAACNPWEPSLLRTLGESGCQSQTNSIAVSMPWARGDTL